jgi:outer membrane murein-binding lipoprotein Lpp
MSHPPQPPAWEQPQVVSSVTPSPAGSHEAPAAHRRGSRAVVVVLTLLLLSALGVGAYLWLTTLRWQEDSAVWEAQARDHAAQVAALQAELDGVNAELLAAREQLATATERITELADEKAQLGDETVAAQRYLDYQTRVSEAAGVVATALGQCIQAQSQLIGYLENRDAYDPEDLERFATDVQAVCDEATRANEQLQQELQQ